MATNNSLSDSSSSSSDSDDSSRITKSMLGIGSSSLARMARSNAYLATTLPTIYKSLAHVDDQQKQKRRYIKRDWKEAHDRLMKHYFNEDAKYGIDKFIRRLRMDKTTFLKIVAACEEYDPYFVQRRDATGKLGLSSLQKVSAVVRMLAYGCAADLFDEYLQIGETTTIESLKHFCDVVIGIYEEQYLRKPTQDDVKRLLEEGKDRGFPGMLGSLDCMHWEWKNCPTAWHGQYTSGHKKAPTLILEAVASKDLWIWHAFFGMAGSNNDINVLDRSPLFDDIINENAPKCEYVVNGHHYNMGYYLSNNIYPQYATLIQMVSQPWRAKDKLFTTHVKAARKDIERAFGVLQAKWHIVKSPGRSWSVNELGKIMKICIILHNMIIESRCDEHMIPTTENTETNIDEHISMEHDNSFLTERMTNGLNIVQNRAMHLQLKNDLIEHLWIQHGAGNI